MNGVQPPRRERYESQIWGPIRARPELHSIHKAKGATCKGVPEVLVESPCPVVGVHRMCPARLAEIKCIDRGLETQYSVPEDTINRIQFSYPLGDIPQHI